MKRLLRVLVITTAPALASAQTIASESQSTVTISPGSGIMTVGWTSKSVPDSTSPYVSYLATIREGEAPRPIVSLDFREVEKRLGECRDIAWFVDGSRIAPSTLQYSADDAHKRTIQSLSFTFSIETLAAMARGNTSAEVCGEVFQMDNLATKALDLFVAEVRRGIAAGQRK